MHFLADDVAATRGRAEPARRTAGSDSLDVLGNPGERRIQAGPLRIPAGAELRLDIATDAAERVAIVAFAPAGRSRALAAGTVRRESGWTDVRVPLDGARTQLGAELRLVFKARTGRAVWFDPMIIGPESASTPNDLKPERAGSADRDIGVAREVEVEPEQ